MKRPVLVTMNFCVLGLSAYRAVNTFHFGYEKQSVKHVTQNLLFILRSVQNT